MLSHEDRISAVVKQIESLKNTNKELESERDLLRNKVAELEEKVEAISEDSIAAVDSKQKEEQKRKEEELEMSMSSVELKQEISRHIEGIDECLDLLKTI